MLTCSPELPVFQPQWFRFQWFQQFLRKQWTSCRQTHITRRLVLIRINCICGVILISTLTTMVKNVLLYYQDSYLSLLLLRKRFERISVINHSLLLCVIFYPAIPVELFTQIVSLKFKGLRRCLQRWQFNTEMHQEINEIKKFQTRLEMYQCKRKPVSQTQCESPFFP